MANIKLPLRLLISDTRTNAMLFALTELENFMQFEVGKAVTDGATTQEVVESVEDMLRRLKRTIEGVKLVHLPDMNLDGISVEIPEEMTNYPEAMRKLQQKINIAEAVMKEWDQRESQQDISARYKKPE